MTVTFSANRVSNRYNTAHWFEWFGSTVGTGTMQTARHSGWLYRDGTLVDYIHSGPLLAVECDPFGADDVDWEFVPQTLEQGAGSVSTATSLTWTNAVTAIDRTYYVDTAGSDSNDGLSTGAAKATIAGAWSAAQTYWGSNTRSVAILLKAGQTHAISSAIACWGFDGRILVDRYSTGADPIIDPATDIGMFEAVGATGFGSSEWVAVSWRNCDWTGTSTTASNDLVTAQSDTTSSTILNPSHVFSNLALDSLGTFLLLGTTGGHFSDAEKAAGALDCVLVKNVVGTNTNSYGIYAGFHYFCVDGFDWSTANTANTSAIRSYDSRYWLLRNSDAWDLTSDSFRMLSSTRTNDTAARYWVMSGCGAWNSPYLVHNVSSEGGDTTENKFEDVWYHGLRGNPVGSGGGGIVLGGNLQRTSIRACWLRNATVDIAEQNTDNDDCSHFHMECNTLYTSSASGGDGIGLRSSLTGSGTVSNFHINNNFQYLAAGSGGVYWCGFAGSHADSILATSNGNILSLSASFSGSILWYDNLTSGGVALSSWQGSTAYDDNSDVISSGTHGFTAVGTTGEDDFDFSISSSSDAYDAGIAVPGADIDFAGNLRITTHDAGASDGDASSGPPEPSGGGGTIAPLAVHHRKQQRGQ